jgi:hypothetical protein
MSAPPPFDPHVQGSGQGGAAHGAMVRAACGPLLLTTLGVLLAIDYSGQLSFSRTWPALLIIFGLCKLAERMGGA